MSEPEEEAKPQEESELEEEEEDVIQAWRQIAAALEECPEVLAASGLTQQDIEAGNAAVAKLEELEDSIKELEEKHEALRVQRKTLLN